MSRAVQRRATSRFVYSPRQESYQQFVDFLVSFIDELNALSTDGAAVLVEGQRDRSALLDLGYDGKILTKTSLSPARLDLSLRGVRSIVILTDMDREGRRLAAKYTALFQKMKVSTSLAERRRLKRASGGVFLHIENLSRFSPEVPEIREMTSKMSV